MYANEYPPTPAGSVGGSVEPCPPELARMQGRLNALREAVQGEAK